MPCGGLKESGSGEEGPPYAVNEVTGAEMVVTYLPLAFQWNDVAAIWRRRISSRHRNKMESSDQLAAVPSFPAA